MKALAIGWRRLFRRRRPVSASTRTL